MRHVIDHPRPALLALVGEPRRWALLVELGRSDRRVGELAAQLDMPQSLVSYHLRELRDAGVVTGRRSSADGRDTYYRADLSRCRELLADAAVELHPTLGVGFGTTSGTVAPTVAHRRRVARVLFLCTGNSARSQMAEALVTARSGHAIVARSAGSHPKPLHPLAVETMAGRGLDISAATSKHLRRFVRQRFDRVVTLCDKVREICPEFPPPARPVHWSIADPAAPDVTDPAAAFAAVADELDARIEALTAELTQPERIDR